MSEEFPKRILLATDGSEDAALAARAATDLAEATKARLHVVHVWQAPLGDFAAFSEIYSTYYKSQAQEVLAEQVNDIEARGGKVAEAHLRERVGAVADEILDVAEELGAGLIIVGSRGLGSVGRLALGSVSEGVVHHAQRPVLVMRGGKGAWPPQRVIIGNDGSETARQTAKLAAEMVKPFGVNGVLVRCYPEMPEIDVEGRTLDPRLVDDALRRAQRVLEERAEELTGILGRRPRVRIAVGEPARTIVEAASEGDERKALVAVGSRGLGAVGRMRLGSVSTKVLRGTEGPVLIYPSGAI